MTQRKNQDMTNEASLKDHKKLDMDHEGSIPSRGWLKKDQ
jgi:hypothetical protein